MLLSDGALHPLVVIFMDALHIFDDRSVPPCPAPRTHATFSDPVHNFGNLFHIVGGYLYILIECLDSFNDRSRFR